MELILREDVQNLGFKDDIVKVKNGYGRNFLIPHGKAVIATSSARKVLAENLKQRAFKEQKLVDDANKLGKKLQGFEIKIKSKVAPKIFFVGIYGYFNGPEVNRILFSFHQMNNLLGYAYSENEIT